jgi:hypothetical protein
LKVLGTTQDFGPSEALVVPWIVNGNLTSFLGKNKTLGLRDRLLLVRTSSVPPVHTVKLIGFVHKLRGIAAGLDYRE